MSQTNTMKRQDAPEEMTWNKEAVFDSWDEWQNILQIALGEISEITEFAGTFSQSPERLVEWFAVYKKHFRRLMKLTAYCQMHYVVDSSDNEAKGNMGQLMGLFGQFNANAAFVEPELQEIGEDLRTWAKEIPELNIYKKYFDDLLRQKKHLRSTEIEEVLGTLTQTFSGPSQINSSLTNQDMKFADAVDSEGNNHSVAQSTITPTGIHSSDREHRRTAWENFCDAHLAMENTLASTYLTNVNQQIALAKIRDYENVLEMQLDPVGLPNLVYENLISVCKKRVSVWHKYWDVKRQILEVDQLHPYDIWAPIVDKTPVIPYTKSVDWIAEALLPLGQEYVSVMRSGALEDRWVDWAPNEGKRQGAASMGGIDSPPFLFMSYDDTLLGTSVLAHELGHSMHSYFMDKNQVEVYSGYNGLSMSVAETASNFNQAMTREFLRKEKGDDRDFQIAMIDEAIFNFHRYFFQMPNLARFEMEVYTQAAEGRPLTAPALKEIMKNIYTEGYGDTMVDDPERTSITWAQFSHLYVPFYTFQYAIGISAAHSMADKVLAGEENATENYLNFLKAGSSRYPMDLFELGGADMSSTKPIEKAFDVLESMVDQLAELV